MTLEPPVILLARRDNEELGEDKRRKLAVMRGTWRVEIAERHCELFIKALALRKHLTLAWITKRLDIDALVYDWTATASSCWRPQ